ncbi:CDP-glycerol glycerophosphotransferase family protein [Mycoplasma marinum]|uniref:Uncharacterized protein n=1 Tax=Mycoplasma marinum TaxID=1937190 RepID=A0A4R0XLD7_9MOLU|nr:CDP-glycerol glycerophosphotransferase family protein [Mycoplasma marinum]TCG11486.1 hypothetical protein C4B24_01880 [Mycoplasma marinum]
MKKINQFIMIFIHLFFKFLPFGKKTNIIFKAFDDSSEGKYEKVIFDEMYKRYSKKYKFYWIGEKKGNNLCADVKFIKGDTLKAAWVVSRAKYFISGTFSKNPFLSKKTKVFYLNHGYSVKIMGIDWVNSGKGIKKMARKIAHKNQVKQIDICFAHDEYDKKSYERIFAHKGDKKTEFLVNGFPISNKYSKGEDLLFLPSWHEKQEVKFPEVKTKNKFVSFHPRTKNKVAPEGWTIVNFEERKKLKLKYVLSDNSAAPLEYIKSGIQAYWIKGDYDRDFCREFNKKYPELLIDIKNFEPLSEGNYKKVVSSILKTPDNKESIQITVDAMNIQ